MQNNEENNNIDISEKDGNEAPVRKRRIFRWFLLVYVFLFLAVLTYLMGRLYRILESYESAYRKSLPEYYADDAFSKLSLGDFENLNVTLADGNAPGNDDFNNLSIVRDYICAKDTSWDEPYDKQPGEPVTRTQGKAVYEFCSDGMPFVRLTMVEEPGTLDYGFSSWKADALQLLDTACLPSEITIHLPSDATAYVNGTALDKTHVTEDGETIGLLNTLVSEGFLKEDELPTKKTVSVEGLFFDVTVEVKDKDGKNIDCRVREDGVYEAAEFYAPDDFVADISSYVEGMLEPWGLFFSRDGGYYNIQRYFWPGSPVDRYLPKVDVSWMQWHNRVAFENKRVENYRLYNDRCFSCDIHFEQIIGVGDNPEVRRWNTDMTWIFVKPDRGNSYLLTDMMTLTGNTGTP